MSRRPVRHVPKDSSRRRVWVYAAVSAFILFDVALIAFALGTTKADADVAPGVVPTPSSSVTSTPSASPVPEAAAVAASTIVAVPATRLLSAVDGTTAWRATTGTCPAAVASPEVTTDSGATWTTTDATGPTDVTSVQALSAQSGSVVEIVGLDIADCAPEFVKTFVGGDNFRAYPGQLDDQWYVDPANRAEVHAPSGASPAPCDAVLALAPRGPAAAAALCDGDQLFVTTDGAATWSPPVSLPGTVNLASTETGYVAAVAGAAGCSGVQIQALSPELAATVSGCLAVAGDLAGNVALSSAGGTLWVWAGDTVARSADAGATWQ
ncbi:hypothetical protein [Cryobacterium psychrophilum]|uniref:Exo-alpha-sialidase n=1 Tax=Cryobacterium psychrophilum TaxID=41988 RepID=A0A4Y8KP32_9MICO|nr:hypothetical protein [Cryobacterium psychrophilum]TDW30576.1 hypothetical protein EDD25_2340 [Cryobacterium psychrophilum]TFD80207.1 hypothetical protein E3T53_05720 [Cryobacterium psychrophilum]